jgi:nicotinamide mononucleotide transporter
MTPESVPEVLAGTWAALKPGLEPFAVVTGVLSVLLVVRQNPWNWPIGSISVVGFAILFWEVGLYADMSLQVLYVALNLYGWWNWLHGGMRGGPLRVTLATRRARLMLVATTVVAALALGRFLDETTDSTLPYPDAATTVLSVVATYLLARKHIETWPVWIMGVNLPYIAIYLAKGLPLTAALQLVFIALSVAGWLAWYRSLQTDRLTATEGRVVALPPGSAPEPLG